MPDTVDDTKKLVREYKTMWNERDYEAIPELVTESFELHEPAIPEGKHGYDGMEEFLEVIIDSFPDFEVTPTEILVDGDTVMAETEYSLTQEGEFNGIPPTGNTAEMTTMEKIVLEDGKVKENYIYYDQFEFMGELGVDPKQL
ncbi:ester cyclase [Natrialbaceae archaeon A-arb3/5]